MRFQRYREFFCNAAILMFPKIAESVVFICESELFPAETELCARLAPVERSKVIGIIGIRPGEPHDYFIVDYNGPAEGCRLIHAQHFTVGQQRSGPVPRRVSALLHPRT